MLVKKKVFALSELGQCTLEDVGENCVLDFLQKLCEINKNNSTEEYDLNDKERLLDQAQEISFDTNLLKFEMSVTPDEIINKNLDHIVEENEARKQNNSRKDMAQAMEGEDPEELEFLGLQDQVLDVLEQENPINIKIINLGNTDYYFYTI